MLKKRKQNKEKRNRRILDEYVMSMAVNVNRKIVLTCSIFNIPLNYGWLLSFHVTLLLHPVLSIKKSPRVCLIMNIIHVCELHLEFHENYTFCAFYATLCRS